MDLSACLIVKDEERWIGECLSALVPVVDEIVVADTGSTDGTIRIVAGFPVRLLHIPWTDDFSAARNRVLEAAAGRWILSIDADERLTPDTAARLRKELRRSDADGCLLWLHCPAGNRNARFEERGRQCRLFRNDPRFRFRGKIHEQVVDSILEAGGRLRDTDLVINHLGYASDPARVRAKWERNRRLLETQAQENPNDLHRLFLLGRQYVLLGEYERGAAVLAEVVSRETRPAFRVPALNDLALLRAGLRDGWREALDLVRQSLDLGPSQAFPHFIRGRAWRTGGFPQEAATALLTYWSVSTRSADPASFALDVAIAPDRLSRDLLDLLGPGPVRDGFRQEALDRLLAGAPPLVVSAVHNWPRDVGNGIPDCDPAWREWPPAWRDALPLLLRLALPEAAVPDALETLLTTLGQPTPPDLSPEALAELAQTLLLTRRVTAARKAFKTLLRFPPEVADPVFFVRLAADLKAAGHTGSALQILEGAHQIFPVDEKVARALGLALLEVRRPQAALACLRQAADAAPEDRNLASLISLAEKQV